MGVCVVGCPKSILLVTDPVRIHLKLGNITSLCFSIRIEQSLSADWPSEMSDARTCGRTYAFWAIAFRAGDKCKAPDLVTLMVSLLGRKTEVPLNGCKESTKGTSESAM